MANLVEVRETLDDLLRVDGKAELIGGRIVFQMPTGRGPTLAAFSIAKALDRYAVATGRGEAYPDGIGFAVSELPSGRESFSPDASYFVGPFTATRMRFNEGPPTFAVEVRSEGDYGPAAEAQMAAKRADYFLAGTLAVWDVDPVAELIHCYRIDAPETPTTYRRGEVAEAGPAVLGWGMAVDEVFA